MKRRSLRQQQERLARLVPNGEPRWVRCYASADRYVVVFTSKGGHRDRTRKGALGQALRHAEFMTYTEWRGQGQVGWSLGDIPFFGDWPPKMGKEGPRGIGVRVKWSDLPFSTRAAAEKVYFEIWDLPTPTEILAMGA